MDVGGLEKEPHITSICIADNSGHERLGKRRDGGRYDEVIPLELDVVSWVKGVVIKLKFGRREGAIDKLV